MKVNIFPQTCTSHVGKLAKACLLLKYFSVSWENPLSMCFKAVNLLRCLDVWIWWISRLLLNVKNICSTCDYWWGTAVYWKIGWCSTNSEFVCSCRADISWQHSSGFKGKAILPLQVQIVVHSLAVSWTWWDWLARESADSFLCPLSWTSPRHNGLATTGDVYF